jgi:hypothetical protein
MVAVTVMGGLILIAVSVLGEYVWRTLDESRRRPLYLVGRSRRIETSVEPSAHESSEGDVKQTGD